MNILEIVQEVAARMNEPTISDVFDTTNNQANMYLASANKMARDIAKRHSWGALTIPVEFETIEGLQEYPLPCDFQNILTDNLYNSTKQWAIPRETSSRAEAYISTGGTSWSDAHYRIVRDKIRFTVEADAEDTIRYEYKSNAIANCSDQYNDSFTDNDDTYLIDDETLIKGMVFDITRKYGFPDAEYMKSEYELEIKDLITREGGIYTITPPSELNGYPPYPRGWVGVYDG